MFANALIALAVLFPHPHIPHGPGLYGYGYGYGASALAGQVVYLNGVPYELVNGQLVPLNTVGAVGTGTSVTVVK